MKHDIYIAGGSLTLLLLLFFGFDPNKLPSLLLILPFMLLFVVLLCTIRFLLQKRGTSYARSTKIAILCTAIPILLLVLQSIGQLTVRDLLTLGVLFGLSFFYITRATSSA